ncbi:MAG TPA: ribonuclease P protein component [bacterium]|nr:ribonuclease P protein component [bacterium]
MVISSTTGFTLKENIKLKDKKRINYIFNNGSKKIQKVSIVFYVSSQRFRFLISFKRKLFNAVKRNSLKRRIKEFIRLNQYCLKKIDCSILIIRSPSSNGQLLKELGFLLDR